MQVCLGFEPGRSQTPRCTLLLSLQVDQTLNKEEIAKYILGASHCPGLSSSPSPGPPRTPETGGGGGPGTAVGPALVSVAMICDMCFPHEPENFWRFGTVSVPYLDHWHPVCVLGVSTSPVMEPEG